MEREYEAADDGVIELGVASEMTNGFGDGDTDNPDRQSQLGSLEN
ncbi:benenodin family lasso peptide [Novosphingobium resinovorum]|nr:benenodin family lasso peptide [Novosphingobium resinovorum]